MESTKPKQEYPAKKVFKEHPIEEKYFIHHSRFNFLFPRRIEVTKVRRMVSFKENTPNLESQETRITSRKATKKLVIHKTRIL